MGDWELISGQKIAFQNKLYGSTDQRGFRRAYKWGGGGGSLNPGGLYPDKKLRFKTSSNKTLLKEFSRASLEIR